MDALESYEHNHRNFFIDEKPANKIDAAVKANLEGPYFTDPPQWLFHTDSEGRLTWRQSSFDVVPPFQILRAFLKSIQVNRKTEI